MSVGFFILLILFFLAASAFFSGMETGVISANRLRIEHHVHIGDTRAKILQRFRAKSDHLLGTTLAGTNLFNVATSIAMASFADRILTTWGPLVSGVLTTIMLLIWGEYIPKAYFRAAPTARSLRWARLLQWSGWLFLPLSRTAIFFAKLLVPTPRKENPSLRPILTREELLHHTQESAASGKLTEEEHQRIHGVLQLNYKKCHDIMVPLNEIIYLNRNASRDEIITQARTNGFSRIPVMNEQVQRFVGILYIFDVLADTGDEKKTARDYMRPPHFVAESTPADEALPRMRLNHQPMILVTDDERNVTGLITVELILKEIVGTT